MSDFRIPLLPKLAFWFDFLLAVIVGRIIQSEGDTSDPWILLLLAPLLANALMLLKVKFAEVLGYVRAILLVGLFLYAVRDDLTSLNALQMVITAIVIGYHIAYVAMVKWYAKVKRISGTLNAALGE